MTGPAIEVESLTMRYPKVPRLRDLVLHPFRRDSVLALDDVSLTVEPRQLFGFLGPNGAGKTTLIKILTTLILPTSGSVRVAGLDVTRSENEVKRRIGVVMSDERSFDWRLTARQNLRFFAALYGLHGRRRDERVEELLELVDLANRGNERFSGFSSGMKQKLVIARGLLADPDIIFFDEPTRSLDPISAAQVRTFVQKRLVRDLGKTVFLTTHNLHEAEEISDRVGIINRGRILAVGTVPQISARLRSREHYRLVLLTNGPTNGGAALPGSPVPAGDPGPDGAGPSIREVAEAIGGLPGIAESRVQPAEDGGSETIHLTLADASKTVPEIVALAVARGARVLECARRESSLSELFAEIISEDARPGAAKPGDRAFAPADRLAGRGLPRGPRRDDAA